MALSVRGEYRLFAATLIISLLLHFVALCMGQGVSILRNERSSATFQNAVEVVLASSRMLPESVAAHPEVINKEKVTTPLSQLSEHSVENILDEQMSAKPDTADASEIITNQVAGAVRESLAQASAAVNKELTDQYLSSVLARIESRKFYPESARRRGVEGQVRVCFTIDAEGLISRLETQGDHFMLENAATEAIRNALPLPSAPSSNGFPMTVRFEMLFKLQ